MTLSWYKIQLVTFVKNQINFYLIETPCKFKYISTSVNVRCRSSFSRSVNIICFLKVYLKMSLSCGYSKLAKAFQVSLNKEPFENFRNCYFKVIFLVVLELCGGKCKLWSLEFGKVI